MAMDEISEQCVEKNKRVRTEPERIPNFQVRYKKLGMDMGKQWAIR